MPVKNKNPHNIFFYITATVNKTPAAAAIKTGIPIAGEAEGGAAWTGMEPKTVG